MESEKDLPFEQQKAKEMGCLDIVERRAVHDLRTKLEGDPNVLTFSYSFDWKKDGIDISREDAAMKQLCSRLCKASDLSFMFRIHLPCGFLDRMSRSSSKRKSIGGKPSATMNRKWYTTQHL